MRISIKRYKLNKKKYLSMFLLFIMLISTFGYSVIQSMRREGAVSVELPGNNILNHALTSEQKYLAITKGITLMEYTYPENCGECNDRISYFESLASEFSDQIILEKLIDARYTKDRLNIISYYGNAEFEEPSIEEVFNSLCQLMVKPPIRCVAINLKN